VAGIGLLMGCVSADAAGDLRGALEPPVMREPFTLLPCPPHQRTTVDFEGCVEHALVRSDRQIDARVKRVFDLISLPATRATFVRAERARLSYRRSSCTVQSSFLRGGSARPLEFLTCELHRNKGHLAELAETEQALHSR
jgi:uncharacterized protein YecT (DUF1311 family)